MLPLALLGLFLAGCGNSASSPNGNAASRTSALVHLPADQAAHTHAHNEWWYVVGHLHRGKRYFGYEVTTFKIDHVRPPGFSSPVTLYRTDVAITDIVHRRFDHQITYWFPEGQTLSTHALDIHVGNVLLQGATAASMHLQAHMPLGRVALQLSSKKPAMDVGGRGYLSFGNGYTYYYSLTDLASRGSLSVAGRRYSVGGISWLDHQWGNWSWRSFRGWTWMALQLDSGVQLSLFDVRGAKQGTRLVSVLLQNGRLRTLRRLTITPTGTWVSPHTGARYPSGWTLRIPGMRAVLRVQPSVLDQEMTVPGQRRASYWEGTGRTSGTFLGKSAHGFSYTELTGYAP